MGLEWISANILWVNNCPCKRFVAVYATLKDALRKEKKVTFQFVNITT